MKRYCLAVDLKDDPSLITEYEDFHKPGHVWPEVLDSLKQSGIIDAQIYRTGTRLVMILETTDEFSLEKKAVMDRDNPAVQKWETLMWKFQEPLPWTPAGEKWARMDPVFQL